MNTTTTWTARVRARTANGLATELAELIGNGEIAEGARLPTIREVADVLHVSVGTVADAWSTLRARNLIETRRRGGTRVRAGHTARVFRGWSDVDFLLSSPDAALQPSLESALVAGLAAPGVNVWGREHMVPALATAVAPAWPYPAEAWTTAGGGTEGLWLATRASLMPGRPVAVEEPAPPGFLATLREMGAEVIGVRVDEEGPDAAALRRALDAGAALFVHQPGGPFSDRHVLSAERAAALAEILGDGDAVIIEDDSLGPLSAVPARTLGSALPDRTLRVLSYCKAFGLDLRTSVIGGPRRLVDAVISARSGGVASTSRILQNALAVLLGDAGVAEQVAAAREHYATRRRLALDAFARAGLVARSGPGSLVLWVEVPDAQATVLALATQRIVVESGATSWVTPPEQPVLRLSVAQLPEDPDWVDELAHTVKRAAIGDLRVVFG